MCIQYTKKELLHICLCSTQNSKLTKPSSLLVYLSMWRNFVWAPLVTHGFAWIPLVTQWRNNGLMVKPNNYEHMCHVFEFFQVRAWFTTILLPVSVLSHFYVALRLMHVCHLRHAHIMMHYILTIPLPDYDFFSWVDGVILDSPIVWPPRSISTSSLEGPFCSCTESESLRSDSPLSEAYSSIFCFPFFLCVNPLLELRFLLRWGVFLPH